MEWAYFKVGTYWIYEEESSGARDTFTVLSNHDYVTNPTTEPYEYFDYTTKRSSDGYFYMFWFNEGWTSSCELKGNCCSCRTLWCDKYIPGDLDGEDRLFRFPTFEGNYAYSGWGGGDYGKITVQSYYDSLVIEDQIFHSVTTQHVDNSVLDQSPIDPDYYETTYFFAKSIGIVKKEIAETNETWNLVEYNIQQ